MSILQRQLRGQDHYLERSICQEPRYPSGWVLYGTECRANNAHSSAEYPLTARVIQALNHMDLSGRKLHVEYQKMPPLAPKERIERERRERGGQLEDLLMLTPTDCRRLTIRGVRYFTRNRLRSPSFIIWDFRSVEKCRLW